MFRSPPVPADTTAASECKLIRERHDVDIQLYLFVIEIYTVDVTSL